MSDDARQQAIDAALQQRTVTFTDGRTGTLRDMLQAILDEEGAEQAVGAVLDAIPAPLLARLAIERGGMEQCGYRWVQSAFGTWVVHHWPPDDYTQRWPVYRLAGEDDGE